MLDILIAIIFIIGILTVGKSIFNISTNILVWVVIGLIVYLGLQYFGVM